MKQIGNEIIETINRVVESNAEDLNKFVPKRCFKKVEAINKELQDLKNMTGDEYPEILDTSAGYESFTKILSPVRIENGEIIYTEEDNDYWHSDRKPSEERSCIVDFDEEEQTYYFRDYEYKDVVDYLTKGVRKAKKYFLEYNPEWDENDTKRENFFNEM